MSSEAETSRESTLKVSQRDPSTSLGMTKIALIQMRCGPEPDKNFAHAIDFIRDAAKSGALIVCLPELFRSQYFCQTEDHDNFSLAETIPGPSTDALTKLARELGVVIVASLFEKRTAGLYHNTAAIIDADGELLGKYRKMHIPDDPLYLREILFYAGRSRFSELENSARQSRRLRLLGPVVSRSGAPDCVARRGDYFLSDRDRLAPEREEGIWQSATFRLGNDSTQSCHCEWLLRRGAESRRTRSARWR